MRHIALITFFFLFNMIPSFNQTEGWSSSCSTNTPSVSEVMTDACGDEFKSEYVVLRTGNQPFDISKFGMQVINPTNNAFVGAVTIQKGNINNDALQTLSAAAGAVCPFGTVFRDVFAPPYNGVVPANSAILFFNNKDSTDVGYLSPNTLTSLCGSKVFVAFGDLRPQSRGASIFRNYPQNGACGNGGCLREIQFQFEGQNAPYCTQLTYDIKKLPHLNTTNPPVGFNEGSYIRPAANGIILYGGGNLTGTGVCLPPDSLTCIVPLQPDYGQGFWSVLVYEGLNNFTNFKGFYEAKGNHPTSIAASTGSFEYNTERDGWKPYEAPSEAHSTYGALKTYGGCNVRKDSFSIIAKRHGFPCGNYDVKLLKYDDFTRIRIDDNGDGTWDYDHTFNAPACAADCNTTIWSGTLGSDSKMAIWSYDIHKNFNTILVFDKKNTSSSAIQIVATVSPTLACNTPTGSISLKINGGVTPYTHTWTGVSPISNNVLLGTNLLSGIYKVVVRDGSGCRDSMPILVPQTNTIVANAGRDTAFCAGGTAILRGGAIGTTSALTYEWATESGVVLSNQRITSATPSISTTYILKTTDTNGCFDTDTVFIKINDPPYLTLTVSTSDAICNNEKPILKVRGAQNYAWTTFPPIAGSALSSRIGDSIALFTLFLPAPVYDIKAEGTDANGCVNTIQTTITVIPLPAATIDPITDTLCSNGLPRVVVFTPTTGNLDARIQATNAPCVNCIIGNKFYPTNSGVGKFTIYNQVINSNGCQSNPAIEVSVKSCNTCLKTDTTFLASLTCNPLTVGQLKELKKNRLGCDSLIITNFILAPKDTFHVVKTTCDRAQQGTQTATYKNIYGCDSIVITTTNLIKSDTTYSFSTSCNPRDTGFFALKFINFKGCDSIHISKITLSKIDTTHQIIKTCNPAQAGQKTILPFKNLKGCDSLVVTTFLLNRRDSLNINATVCAGDSVRVGSLWYKNAGIYPLRSINTEGCDSIVILNLNYSKKDSIVINKTSCNIIRVGQTVHRLQNLGGCDSLVITRTTFTPSPLSFNVISSKPISCAGKNDGIIDLKVVNMSTPPYTVRWMTNDTTMTLKNIRAGLYRVTVTDAEGCIVNDSFRFNDPAPMHTYAESISPKCFEDKLGSIRLNSVLGGTAPYKLLLDSTVLFNIPTLPFIIPNIEIGHYIATLIDKNNCTSDTSFDITTGRKLLIHLAKSAQIDLGDTISLNANINYALKSVKWTPSEGILCDTCLITLAIPSVSTVYKLTVKDIEGCQVSQNISVVVDKKNRIFAPNSFSPNGDGENDVFTIFTDASVKRIKTLKVFNRWGNMLFESFDFTSGDTSKGWNGTFKGTALATDVYIFFAEIEFIDGKKGVFQGDVSLMR